MQQLSTDKNANESSFVPVKACFDLRLAYDRISAKETLNLTTHNHTYRYVLGTLNQRNSETQQRLEFRFTRKKQVSFKT